MASVLKRSTCNATEWTFNSDHMIGRVLRFMASVCSTFKGHSYHNTAWDQIHGPTFLFISSTESRTLPDSPFTQRHEAYP